MANVKTIGLWFGVNENKKPSYHLEKPTRNFETKAWCLSSPFCSSVLCNKLDEMIMNTPLSWENEPEYIEIPINHDFAKDVDDD